MKKILLTLIILCFLTTMSYTQTIIGLKMGLNFSNLYGNDISNSKILTGVSAGAFLSYKFSDIFDIQPEVYFSRKGAKEKGVTDTETFDYEFALDYIEIPLLLKFSLPIQGLKIRPIIFGGPAISFNTNAKISREINGYAYDVNYDYIKSTEFSFVLGAGISFPTKHYDWGFDIRYILGLTKIDDSGDNADTKNKVIILNAFFGTSLF